MSDIHDDWENFPVGSMPAADLCMIAGDLTNYGTARPVEIDRARDWLRRMASRMLVLWIPGNHDIGMDHSTFADLKGVSCIQHETVGFLTGNRREAAMIHGISLSPCYDMPHLEKNWVNMTTSPGKERDAYEFAPVQVVLSHCPPFGMLDNAGYVFNGESFDKEQRHIGSLALANYIYRESPLLVICGHAHGNQGSIETPTKSGRPCKVLNTAQKWEVVELTV